MTKRLNYKTPNSLVLKYFQLLDNKKDKHSCRPRCIHKKQGRNWYEHFRTRVQCSVCAWRQNCTVVHKKLTWPLNQSKKQTGKRESRKRLALSAKIQSITTEQFAHSQHRFNSNKKSNQLLKRCTFCQSVLLYVFSSKKHNRPSKKSVKCSITMWRWRFD